MPRHKQNPIDFQVGARIRMRRMLLGMTQEQLGKKLRVSFQQIQKYERGTSRVGASQLFEFAKALSVSIGYFYENLTPKPGRRTRLSEDHPSEEQQFILDFVASAEGLGLSRAYTKIRDSKLRRHILDLVRGLAASDGYQRRR